MSLLSLDIARRYLYGKKSTNSINIITGISIFGISIGTAALVLILSVFNGFEGLLSSMFNSFNPDLKVIPVEGKYFSVSDETIKSLTLLPGVENFAKTIEEVSLFEYKGSKEIGIIKGVDENYKAVTGLDTLIVNGRYLLKNNDIQYAIVGKFMRNKLSLNIEDRLTPITIYMPQKKQKILGAKEFKSRDVYAAGVFSVKSDTDYQYMICNIEFVSSLLEQNNKISALEIKLTDDQQTDLVKEQVQEIFGSAYFVKNRYEQDKAYLNVIEIEKWFSFLIAGLTMLLIAFNLVGALWMIVLDKKKDIAVLKAMGYANKDVKYLFLILGFLITAFGILFGFILALIAYYLQKNYGLIGIGEGFFIDSYPVKLKVFDFMVVSVTVAIIGWLASLLPAFKASKSELVLKAQY